MQQATRDSVTVCARRATALGGVHALAEDRPRTVRLGIIGCGGIMTRHVKGLVERREAVSIAWLCDVDPAQIDKMAGHVSSTFNRRRRSGPRAMKTCSRTSDVDACIIATPHHWHAPIALARDAGRQGRATSRSRSRTFTTKGR